jgi:hypothetical protein
MTGKLERPKKQKGGPVRPLLPFCQKIAHLIWLIQAKTEIGYPHKNSKLNLDRRNPRLVDDRNLPDLPISRYYLPLNSTVQVRKG